MARSPRSTTLPRRQSLAAALAAASTGLLALASGCGSNDEPTVTTDLALETDGQLCASTPEACGGDVVGKWVVDASCFTKDPSPTLNPWGPTCDDSIQDLEMTLGGTYEFTADGEVTVSTSISTSSAVGSR